MREVCASLSATTGSRARTRERRRRRPSGLLPIPTSRRHITGSSFSPRRSTTSPRRGHYGGALHVDSGLRARAGKFGRLLYTRVAPSRTRASNSSDCRRSRRRASRDGSASAARHRTLSRPVESLPRASEPTQLEVAPPPAVVVGGHVCRHLTRSLNRDRTRSDSLKIIRAAFPSAGRAAQ